MAVDIAANEVSSGVVALAAGVEETVRFAMDLSTVEVLVLDASQPVWFSVDKSTATVGGRRCYAAPSTSAVSVDIPTPGDTHVRLVSAAAATIVVTRA